MSAVEITDNASSGDVTSNRWSPPLPQTLIGCLAAGLLSLLAINAIHPYFAYKNLKELGISPSPELVQEHRLATFDFWTHNYTLDFALVGLFFGLGIGAFTARVRRPLSALAGGLVGLTLGAASGWLVGRFVAQAVLVSADQSLIQSTFFHFAIWGLVLGGVALVVGCLQDGVMPGLNYMVLGIGVGFLVAIMQNLISSIAFSSADLMMIVPTTLPQRATWLAVCSISSAMGIHYGIPRMRHAVRASS